MANFTNLVTAAVAAIVISTACVAAATGPAYSVGTTGYAAVDAPVSVQANA